LSLEINITGAAKLAARLGVARDKIIADVDAAVEAGAELINDTAEELVRVKTGNLKSTIHVEETGQVMERIVKAGGSQAPYAPFIEFGHMTKGGTQVGPFPFMRPALDARSAEIVNLIAKAVLSLLE